MADMTVTKLKSGDPGFDPNQEKFTVNTPGVSSPTLGTQQVYTIPMLNSTIESLRLRKALEIQRWDDRIASWTAVRTALVAQSTGSQNDDPGPQTVPDNLIPQGGGTDSQ